MAWAITSERIATRVSSWRSKGAATTPSGKIRAAPNATAARSSPTRSTSSPRAAPAATKVLPISTRTECPHLTTRPRWQTPSGLFLLHAGDAAARGIKPLAAAGLGLRGSYPLQRFLDPEFHCSPDDLTQFPWLDRLGAALDQNVAKDNRRLVAKSSE